MRLKILAKTCQVFWHFYNLTTNFSAKSRREVRKLRRIIFVMAIFCTVVFADAACAADRRRQGDFINTYEGGRWIAQHRIPGHVQAKCGVRLPPESELELCWRETRQGPYVAKQFANGSIKVISPTGREVMMQPLPYQHQRDAGYNVEVPLAVLPTPPVITEKGIVQAPTPRPLPDFPVAKPQSAKPAVEMSRQEKQKQWPWQVKNETNINIVVNPPAFDSGEDKKIASWLRPGELLLMQRRNGIWTAEQRKTNEIPPDYTLREGKETGS